MFSLSILLVVICIIFAEPILLFVGHRPTFYSEKVDLFAYLFLFSSYSREGFINKGYILEYELR